MFIYNIVQTPNFDIDKKCLDEISNEISNCIDKKQNGILDIVFLDDNRIQNLNKNYRGVDKSTDVLSFHYFDDFSKLKEDEVAGEIILSEEKVISQGKEYGLGTQKEFYKLIIHSTLHILGFDHEKDEDYKEMQALEDKIWNNIF